MAYNKQRFNQKAKCNQCGSEEIKSRRNYSHGKSSRAKVSHYCSKCGSADINVPQKQTRFRR